MSLPFVLVGVATLLIGVLVTLVDGLAVPEIVTLLVGLGLLLLADRISRRYG
jgi:hypothetical protein